MRSNIIIFFGSILFTIMVMGEQFYSLGQHIPGIPNDDSYQSIYLHDMVHRSLGEGNLVFWDFMQFFPYGYHVPSTNGGNYLEMLSSGILKILFPTSNWYGFAHFFWIPINILCFIPLGRYLWNNNILAFSIAASWATLPYTLSFIAYGRLTQSIQFAIPLCILFFLRSHEQNKTSSPYLLGFTLALAAWSYWYFAIFLLLLSPFFWIQQYKKNTVREITRHIAITLGIMSLCIAPLLYVVYYPVFIGDSLPSPPVSIHSMSPIFPDAVHLIPTDSTTNLLWTMFPISIWIFTCVGLVVGQRKKTWGALTLTCICFSMGPALVYNDLVWFLPYFPFWKTVPLLDRLLHPDRWMLIGGIFICILAGEGLWKCTQKIQSHRWKQVITYSAILLPLFGLFESRYHKQLPLAQWEHRIPKIWQLAQKETGAIIVVPVMRAQRVTRFQPYHKRPLLGGMVENQPWTYNPEFQSMIESNGLLMDLFTKNDGNAKDFYVYQDDIDALRSLGYTQIVFSQEDWNHLNHPKTQSMDMIQIMSNALGSPKTVTTEGDAIWDIPTKGRQGHSPAAGGSIQNIGPADPVPEGAPPI